MKPIKALVIIACVALGGCSGNSIWHEWMRVDGQRTDETPAIAQQYTYDVAECLVPANKLQYDYTLVDFVPVVGSFTQQPRMVAADAMMVNCMAGRGYIRVKKSEIDEKISIAREAYLERQKLEKGAEARKAESKR